MTRRLPCILLLVLAPTLSWAASDADLAARATAALKVERKLAQETDPAAREKLQQDVVRADAAARAAAREDLRSAERSQERERAQRANLRDVRVIEGRELAREHDRSARSSDRMHERMRDDRRDLEREREREREEDRDDDPSETGSHDDGSGGTGDDHDDGGT